VLIKPISKVSAVHNNQEAATENPYIDMNNIKTISEKLEEDDDIVNV